MMSGVIESWYGAPGRVGRISTVPSGRTRLHWPEDPALKRWAIIRCPSGTEAESIWPGLMTARDYSGSHIGAPPANRYCASFATGTVTIAPLPQ